MTPQEFLDEFGTLAESADGVPKLRELILELAVRGKLVEQDESDEPAFELISRVERDIARATKSRAMKKPKLIESCEEPHPYQPPTGWVWSQLGKLTAAAENAMCDGPFGSKLKTSHYIQEKGYAVIRLGNIAVGEFLWGKEGHIPQEHYESLASNHVESGDLIIAGMADPIVRCCEVPSSLGPAVNKADCFRLKVHSELDRTYVMHYLNSPTARQFAEGDQQGMTRQRINLTNTKALPVPVPPLAEQHRIVSKVDELMGLCDRLEAVQHERRGVRLRLNRSSLDRLTSSGVRADVSAAWQRVCDHFEVLYDTPETLPDLRQTILQLAVQGKLVPQDPNDEPAEPPDGEGEAPAEPRANDETARQEPRPPSDGATIYPMVTMEELVGQKNMKNGLSVTQTTAPTEYRCLSLSALRDGVVDCSGGKPVPLAAERAEPYLIRRNDVFVVRGNGSKDFVGRAGIANPDDDPVGAIFPDLFIRLPLDTGRIDLDYFLIAWNAPLTRVTIEELAQTTSEIWKVNQGHIASISIPLPGLSEQKRIVSKVTHLLSQVTRLESTLTRREAGRTQPLTTAIHRILN